MYCKFFTLIIATPIHYYGNNLEVIKVKLIKENPSHFNSIYKSSNHDTTRTLQLSIHLRMNFARGCISKSFGKTITTYYDSILGNKTKYSRKGWAKKAISLLLDIHLDKWSIHCQRFFDKNSNSKCLPLLHQSLLITVQLFHDKKSSLSFEQQIWFNTPIEEYDKWKVNQI